MSGVVDVKIRLDNFISKSKETHSIEYDYSKVVYINGELDVTIICPVHGAFNQKPNVHVRGSDCPSCSRLKQVKKKSTTEAFIRKAQSVHGDKYSYDKTEYTLVKNKVIITCPTHGDFEQKANSHLNGYGCYECGLIQQKEKRTYTLEDILDKFKNVHDDLYDYSKVNYVNVNTKVEIVCKTHGSFLQTPKNHLYGSHCPQCGTKVSKPEKDILAYIRSVYDREVIQSYRPEWLSGKEIDIYIPELNVGIEYNGTSFHHSSKSEYVDKYYLNTTKPNNYHFNKWKSCFENNVTLLSIYDFYWIDDNKKNIYMSKIRHHLNLDTKVFARKCKIVEIPNLQAYEFYERNHIEGKGFAYKDSKSFGLVYNDILVMCCTIGQLYNQSAKSFKFKLHRICTLLDYTVIGGVSKLNKVLKQYCGSYSYQITLSSGGTVLNTTDTFAYIQPRYFWVKPTNLQYYHRNYCQKHLLEKHFGVVVDSNDTESTYMEKLGFLKVYDNGLAEITIK